MSSFRAKSHGDRLSVGYEVKDIIKNNPQSQNSVDESMEVRNDGSVSVALWNK